MTRVTCLSRRDVLAIVPPGSGPALTESVVLELLVPSAEVGEPAAQVGHTGLREVVGDLVAEPEAGPGQAGGLLGAPNGQLRGGPSSQEGAVARAVEGGMTVLASKHHHRLQYVMIRGQI